MALIKKFRRSFFGGYKKKDVEAFLASVVEIASRQQQIINSKVGEIENLTTQISDFEIEKLVFEQEIRDSRIKQNTLADDLVRVEARKVELETENASIRAKYESDIASLEDQLEELKLEVESLNNQKSDVDERNRLSENVSDILMGAEMIASEIIEEAKKVNENMTSNIVDITSVVRAPLERSAHFEKNIDFDSDLRTLESELANIQNEINQKIEDTLKSIESFNSTESENLVLRSAGE